MAEDAAGDEKDDAGFSATAARSASAQLQVDH